METQLVSHSEFLGPLTHHAGDRRPCQPSAPSNAIVSTSADRYEKGRRSRGQVLMAGPAHRAVGLICTCPLQHDTVGGVGSGI